MSIYFCKIITFFPRWKQESLSIFMICLSSKQTFTPPWQLLLSIRMQDVFPSKFSVLPAYSKRWKYEFYQKGVLLLAGRHIENESDMERLAIFHPIFWFFTEKIQYYQDKIFILWRNRTDAAFERTRTETGLPWTFEWRVQHHSSAARNLLPCLPTKGKREYRPYLCETLEK